MAVVNDYSDTNLARICDRCKHRLGQHTDTSCGEAKCICLEFYSVKEELDKTDVVSDYYEEVING